MYWFDIADELLPPVYQRIKDLYQYAKSLDVELRDALANMVKVRENFFVQTCDLTTLEYWESLLGITLYGFETFEERRQFVLLHLNNRFPTSEPYVRSVLTDLFGDDGYTFEIDPYDPFIIHIAFLNAPYDAVKRFMNWFIPMCPAHIRYGAGRRDDANGELFISSISPGEYMCSANASLIVGNGSIFLGQTEYSNVQWAEI
jgi:uncharacterized protein YmfQ (DUF2313 family)